MIIRWGDSTLMCSHSNTDVDPEMTVFLSANPGGGGVGVPLTDSFNKDLKSWLWRFLEGSVNNDLI